MKKTLSMLLALVMVLSMVLACTKPAADNTPAQTQTQTQTETKPTDAPKQDAAQPTAEPEPEIPWDGAYMDRDDYKAYAKNDLEVAMAAMEDQLEDDTYAAVKKALEDGEAAIDAANTLAEVRAAYADAFSAMTAAVPLADGLFTYKKDSNAERTNVLGILERYAVTTGITGITLFENGSYVMYNPRVTLGTENYIVGYGFGILPEGSITADLEYETVDAWKRYYHTEEPTDPGTLNYLNDQGAQVGDLYGYIAASFFTNFMNETKDGYDWVPELATEKPIAVNDEDGDGMATTWRFGIRTGADGLKYTTGSELESRQAFNNREVALEDYIYAFKLLLTQANGLYRGSELANTKSGAIAGAKEYYQGSADGINEELWANVGIKAYEEDGKNWFEVTFTEEQTQFYCMYYISASLYMPVPEEFVDLVTVKNYLGYNLDKTETPVDNSLALGAYYVERYDQDQQIVYAKNPNYVFADTKYSIPGVHVKIFPAAQEDTSAVLNEFLAGHFDASGIPQEYLNEYRNDPRTRTTTGTANFKLNVNATNAETWEYLFGEEGVVTQTPKDSYWEIKPCMGNHHFVQALSYTIDRLNYATARGRVPSVDYLASNYMSDPENGLSYATTAAHKKAIENLLEDTDGYGFSIELARDYFRMALTELEADGAYAPGTKDNPTEIRFEIAWMYPTDEEDYHNEIKNFMETAFNDDSVCGGVYKLAIEYWVGNTWSDVYYNKLMPGQYDLGFGAISGNSLDPIGFVSVLSSDQDISGSFTLNWGVDTNDPEAYPIVYKNMRWSFDALYNSVNSKGIVSKGQNKPVISFNYTPIVKNEDGSYTGSMEIVATLPDLTTVNVEDVVCCNYERYYNGDGQYDESSVEFTVEDKGNGVQVVTFTVPADLAADYATGSGVSLEPTGYTGFDFYYNQVFDGTPAAGLYYSVSEDYFEVPAGQ